ncbi:MAG: hypothetical protein ABI278_03970 [Candidatus Aquilonibacter sp.]
MSALLAVVLAGIGALPVPPRLFCTLVAIGLLAVVAGARMRAAMLGGNRGGQEWDAADRARRIREQRQRPRGRARP